MLCFDQNPSRSQGLPIGYVIADHRAIAFERASVPKVEIAWEYYPGMR